MNRTLTGLSRVNATKSSAWSSLVPRITTLLIFTDLNPRSVAIWIDPRTLSNPYRKINASLSFRRLQSIKTKYLFDVSWSQTCAYSMYPSWHWGYLNRLLSGPAIFVSMQSRSSWYQCSASQAASCHSDLLLYPPNQAGLWALHQSIESLSRLGIQTAAREKGSRLLSTACRLVLKEHLLRACNMCLKGGPSHAFVSEFCIFNLRTNYAFASLAYISSCNAPWAIFSSMCVVVQKYQWDAAILAC